ncbi:hypothetical protein [uncultured Sulfitobacter sp.]|uniref:hypothetical protein n=1 Tax=uncultured Sulfitobacter sp. TaxID=191468 RepID=UPI0026264CE2|nr:hypothetical protein [uncultured Sulfitobacter sp.]
MPAEKNTPEYYTTMAVAKLFEDDGMRQDFMKVYGQSQPQAQKFLEDNLGIPTEMAYEITIKPTAEINAFVGKNVCTYLW